jgi:hypothetical protein
LVRLSFLLLSKALGNKKAVVKPVALLEVAWGIHLEFHQFHRPFSVSGILLISVNHTGLFFWGGGGIFVCSFKEILDSSLHLPLAVYGFLHTGHVVWTAFPSSLQLCWLLLMAEILFLKDHEPWSFPVCEELCYGPYCLRHNFTVS